MTARKVHRLTMAALVLAGFVAGSFVSDWVGMVVLAVTALIMLVSALWRGAGRIRRRAQVVEGGAMLVATGLVAGGASHTGWVLDLMGWVLALLIAALLLLDGLFDVSPVRTLMVRLEDARR